MNKASAYLLKHFLELFSSLFFILFFITSVVFFIKIAALTAVIRMNFLELGTLYVYLLPKTLVYTLPITFFIALCISLFNLSKENETIVLFTLGFDPKKIAKLFFSLSAILSFLLILDILVLIPISKQLNTNFIEYKKAEAKFNIKANEFGQKFSNWLVFIEHGDDNQNYQDLTLYQANSKSVTNDEKLIIASSAAIKNDDGFLRLALNQGKIFEFHKNNEIDQTNFQLMNINSEPKTAIGAIQSIKEYWAGAFVDSKRAYDLSFFILIALFPMATALVAISIGIVTYRYNKGGIYVAIFGVVSIYLVLTTLISTWQPQYSPLIVFPLALIVSYYFYIKRIRRVF